MKHRYINVSISSIVAMMVFAISPATLAETKLDMLDANANALFSDQDIISVDNRRYRRHRRYNRHNRRYNRHNRRYNRHNYRRYNRHDRRYRRHNRRRYYDDRYNTY
jgi:Ni/Co efflux regulator RcnB